MSNLELQKYLDFAISVATEADEIARRYFEEVDLGVEWKENDTPLTIADTTINSLVIEKVKKAFPEHGVIGEEESFDEKNDYVWITDPIDGTIPFSIGMPTFTFCLGLAYKGEMLVAVVSMPMQDKIFSAVKGSGAFMNGVALSVSKTDVFKNSYISAMDKIDRGQDKVGAAVLDMKNRGAIMVGMYSYAYVSMLVAEGHLVASVMGYGSPWDAAAVSLIVEEAGGRASDISGKRRKYNEWGEGTLLSNGSSLHQSIVEIIGNANPRH